MTSITYDGFTLPNVEPPREVDMGVLAEPVQLLSGKTYVHVNANTRYRAGHRGFTDNFTDITSLLAKVGKRATLTVDSASYNNCVITSIRWGWLTAAGTYYWYEVEFIQDTSGA